MKEQGGVFHSLVREIGGLPRNEIETYRGAVRDRNANLINCLVFIAPRSQSTRLATTHPVAVCVGVRVYAASPYINRRCNAPALTHPLERADVYRAISAFLRVRPRVASSPGRHCRDYRAESANNFPERSLTWSPKQAPEHCNYVSEFRASGTPCHFARRNEPPPQHRRADPWPEAFRPLDPSSGFAPPRWEKYGCRRQTSAVSFYAQFF